MKEKLYKGQWSKERAWAWHNARPWVRGFNYLPSNCTFQHEMWQEYGFEERMEVMEKEIALAQSVGFNSVRMAMYFEPWKADRDGYMARLERVLQLLDSHGFTMMAKFGNDCTVPKEEYAAPVLGPQKTDWGYHGGVKRSPHRAGLDVGWIPMDDPVLEPQYYEWLRDIISAHKDDPRVVVWNLWNEPGNTKRFDLSEKYLRRFFEIAREIAPIQPLTADSWLMTFNKDLTDPLSNLRDIEFLAMELSDIVSFHHYGKAEKTEEIILELEKHRRPIFCTEWLHRPNQSTFATHLPIFEKHRVAAYNWGLVLGRTQTNLSWEKRDANPPLWQHDLFYGDYTPYDPQELRQIQEYMQI